MFKREVTKAMRNIYVSRAISKLKGKSGEFISFLEMFSNKYSEESVKRALKDLYYCTAEVADIKALAASKTVKYYRGN